MSAQREMSLDEWIGQLPESHRARRELESTLQGKDDRIRSLESDRDEAREGLELIAVAHGWTRQRAWEYKTLAAEIRSARDGSGPTTASGDDAPLTQRGLGALLALCQVAVKQESPDDPPVTRRELAHVVAAFWYSCDTDEWDFEDCQMVQRIYGALHEGRDARNEVSDGMWGWYRDCRDPGEPHPLNGFAGGGEGSDE